MKKQDYVLSRGSLHSFNLFLSFITVSLILFLFTVSANSAEVILAWNSVENSDGYKVYYGSESGTYQSPEDVGAQTSGTISLEPGTYYFAVTAYNNYGESGYSEEVGPTIIGENDPPTAVSLTSNHPSPQQAGTPVTFTAQATGGSGDIEYQFWTRNASDGKWSIAQDFLGNNENTFEWEASGSVDMIGVWARNEGADNSEVVKKSMYFSTDTSPPDMVSLTSAPAGTYVTYTAQASGGSNDYEYRFVTINASDRYWKIAKDFSDSNTYEWTVSDNVGYIVVLARNVGGIYPGAYNLLPLSIE